MVPRWGNDMFHRRTYSAWIAGHRDDYSLCSVPSYSVTTAIYGKILNMHNVSYPIYIFSI